MSSSPDPIQEILGHEGLLARTLRTFEMRPSQIQMARLIQEAIDKKKPALVEAGTGTGKTLGYLVPVLLSKKKTIISTGTKNLQEQIFFKDIPLLSKAIGSNIDAVLMKGRKNYLCLYRFRHYFSNLSFIRTEQNRMRESIENWLKDTEFADRAELRWMRDDEPLWDAFSSTSDQCLGADCIHWDDCYLNALRGRAAQAGIIIVNHHLFFADLMVKKGGFGEVIPRSQVVIFDEAHNIEEIATSYFGESLSTLQLMDFVTDAEKETKNFSAARNDNLKNHLNFIKTGVENLLGLAGDLAEKGRLNQEVCRAIDLGPARLIRRGLTHMCEKSGSGSSNNPQFQALVTRAQAMVQSLGNILSLEDNNWLGWYEKRKKNFVLHASPLDISQYLEKLLYEKIKRIVFTSATLSTNKNFDYIRSRLGLTENVLRGIFPSHFDFEKQALMFIPKDLPPPGDPEFGPKIAKKILALLRVTSGRALVLFTSYHNLNLVHHLMRGEIPYTILKQGEAPRSILLEEFRQDTHSVLLATGSFWQGVDVPGEALSCLIIDKLPFDSPGDPLVAARIESIRAAGGNPFMSYQLPSAIIALKQGLGRLIRNSTDRGIISILDTRLIRSRYGRFFFESLPPIPLIHDLSHIQRFFNAPI